VSFDRLPSGIIQISRLPPNTYRSAPALVADLDL
jgi:hypothetical protein